MGIDMVSHRVEKDPSLHEQVLEVSDLLNRAIVETRTISHLLHPPLLDEIGLESALSVYALGFAKRSGLAVDVNVTKDLGRLDRDTETALFRVMQECLLNVHRHSQSTTASVSLTREDGEIRLQICDQGKGMQTVDDGDGTGFGVGLFGIRERIRQLKGKLEIVSQEGQGTTIIARVPDSANSSALPDTVQLAQSSARSLT
jgi:two-component system, NarL family, sensor kinase